MGRRNLSKRINKVTKCRNKVSKRRNNHINNKDLYQVDFVQPSESYLEILENNKTTTDL